MTQSKTTKRAIKARRFRESGKEVGLMQLIASGCYSSDCRLPEHFVLPADPDSVESMELQIATALKKNDDVWKKNDDVWNNAPVDGYLPDARAVLRSLGLLGGKR